MSVDRLTIYALYMRVCVNVRGTKIKLAYRHTRRCVVKFKEETILLLGESYLFYEADLFQLECNCFFVFFILFGSLG